MDVSVIIPVYNKKEFIKDAVLSALAQDEVKEVILVEDGSLDGGKMVCQQINDRYEKVKLFYHLDKQNHGASASRNLGILKSKSEYIAFLDADDIYIPNRFKFDKIVFEKHDDCLGVYNAIGSFSINNKGTRVIHNELTTVELEVPPDVLFRKLILGECKYFSTDGIVLRKKVFERCGTFDENILTGQDTHMWLKVSSTCNLYPGILKEPVALRRLHDGPKLSQLHDFKNNRDILWRSLFKWSLSNRYIGNKDKLLILIRYINNISSKKNSIITRNILKCLNYLMLFIKYPKVIPVYMSRF